MNVTLIVEGGGTPALNSEAIRQLKRLLTGLKLRRPPAIEFKGSRRSAFDRFRLAIDKATPDRLFILLVDSEAPFDPDAHPGTKHPRWSHVHERAGDNWDRPNAATDDHLHFMATAMETWILADPEAIRRRFPKDFNDNAIPAVSDWESLPKDRVQTLLNKATNEKIGKGRYEKGKISFELLGNINPDTLRKNCPHAHRFFEELERHLG